jgi:PAS domain S-box-containing protein
VRVVRRHRRQPADEIERLFDLSLDLLCIAGVDGYFKQVNRAFERTLGYTAEELLSRPFVDIVHPHDIERTRAAMEALGRGDEVVRFENRYLCKDGSVRWLQWSTRPVLEEGLLYAAARDVTDRRRAEEALRAAQRMVEDSRDELRLLAEEQSALRRVAMHVAQGGDSTEVFHAVAQEIEALMDSDSGGLVRYDPDGAATIVANHTRSNMKGFRVGTRIPLQAQTGTSVAGLVWRTHRAARVSYDSPSEPPLAEARALGLRWAVGAPIFVDGRLWGMIAVAWRRSPPALPDIEERMSQFAELVATAISNAHSRAELTASRARLLATSDDTRRRIERDLHDGAHQRLVSLALGLRAVEEHVPPDLPELRADIDRLATGLAGAVEELNEISRGIHPAILSRGGLGPALQTLAQQAALPVEVDVQVDRTLPEPVEVAAYYVVSEAITNAAKHAHATLVRVELAADDTLVRLAVSDDGAGGADPSRGSGLIGLRDRVEAVEGTMRIASSRGKGTSLEVAIPLGPSSG